MLLKLKDWFKALSFILNDRGFAEGDEGGADNDADTGEGADNAGDTGEEGKEAGEGEGDTGEADNVDEDTLKLFGGDAELAKQFKGDPASVVKSYKELMGKHKPTEMENAAIKKWAEASGLKIVVDAKGSFKGLEVDTTKVKASERQRLFTDEHAKQFDGYFNIKDNPKAGEQFRELLKLFHQDMLGDAFSERDGRMMAAADFRRQERDTEKFIAKVYPEADPDSPDFPEGGTPLYNRATEIYEANESYQHHPKGQLFAVHEAAIELGISPATIAAAKAAGKKEGTEGKRILSKLGGAGAGAGTGKFKKTGEVSLADFVSMTPTERQKYQEEQLKKKAGG